MRVAWTGAVAVGCRGGAEPFQRYLVPGRTDGAW